MNDQPNHATPGVQAVTLTVFCTMGVQRAVEQLAPKFEGATGHRLKITFNTSASLKKRVETGEPADVLISTTDSVEQVIKLGKIIKGWVFPLAHSGVAIAVRKGVQHPDISTPEALKQSLLAARAIGYSDPSGGGASGVHFAKVLERLGIADAVNAKAKLAPVGTFSAQLLIDGAVDIAVQQGPELLSVSGIDIVGPLPGDLQNITVFAAGLLSGSRESDIAKAFMTYLRTPEALSAFEATGLAVNWPP